MVACMYKYKFDMIFFCLLKKYQPMLIEGSNQQMSILWNLFPCVFIHVKFSLSRANQDNHDYSIFPMSILILQSSTISDHSVWWWIRGGVAS